MWEAKKKTFQKDVGSNFRVQEATTPNLCDLVSTQKYKPWGMVIASCISPFFFFFQNVKLYFIMHSFFYF